jgi:hypothetical protein
MLNPINQSQVATYERLTADDSITSVVWDCMVSYNISRNGAWEPSHAYDDGKVGKNIFAHPERFDSRPLRVIKSWGRIELIASMLSEYLLTNKCWEAVESSGITVKFVVEEQTKPLQL